MTSKQVVGKDVEGSSWVVIWLLKFVWRGCRKPWKI